MAKRKQKTHLCKDCGTTDPNDFYADRKNRCQKCHNKKVARDNRNVNYDVPAQTQARWNNQALLKTWDQPITLKDAA